MSRYSFALTKAEEQAETISQARLSQGNPSALFGSVP